MADDKKIISFEIPNTLRKALKLEAFRRDVTISALIRQLLEESLKDVIEECEGK